MTGSKNVLDIRNGMLGSNIHAYTDEDHARKAQFHRDGRVFLKSLAKALELPPGSFEIRNNTAGPAVSGEVTLHAKHLYVQLYESAVRRGISILYRSCESQKDYVGGQNHFAFPQTLAQSEAEQVKFLDACRKLILEGIVNARQRAVA